MQGLCVGYSFTLTLDIVVSLGSKSLLLTVVRSASVLQTEKRSVEFLLDALASENGPAEQETSRLSECMVVPVLSFYKDRLYRILQNPLIKAVAKSVWHLGFFFAPSKVNWSSAADFNEKRIRH